MNEELIIYMLMIVFAGALSLLLCIFSHIKLKDTPGVRPYKIVTLLSAIFTFSYAFELASGTLEEIKFWLGLEYLVIPFIPGFLLLMCLEYVGISLRKKYIVFLFIAPIITVFTHHTNELHHLYYESVALQRDAPFPIVELTYGPFFYVHSFYLFLCLAISITILLIQLKKSLFWFRIQIITMAAGLFLPIVANYFYLNHHSPYGIDLGPVSMSLSFILHGVALFSFQMFNIIPIARDKVFESMLEGVIVLNQNDAIVDFNQAILPVMPMLSTTSIGKPIRKVLANKKKLLEIIDSGEQSDYECMVCAKRSHYQIRFSPVMKENRMIIGKIITFINITERVELQEKLTMLASYDGLTQVYNRTYFMDQSEKRLAAMTDKGKDAALLLFDIDHFKRINDTYGHEAGDKVLCHIANIVKNSLRSTDLIGRYGGEEFIIFLPETSQEDAVDLAEIIRTRISESNVFIYENNIHVTSSIGISQINTASDNHYEAIKLAVRKADHALYAAKRSGRNNVQVNEELEFV
ncbi:histidine kinase N-terminal 7TM domain-containing diguanylate cyclase [Ornithinibacillus xuwenensis]|uniref:Histidine kinase N-terminal 7TM domain-containing protein n=1 Tax=Ornithinibacillus xuwenensis TaxID=3144668 RepID=A0ABU9XKW8_9BACI